MANDKSVPGAQPGAQTPPRAAEDAGSPLTPEAQASIGAIDQRIQIDPTNEKELWQGRMSWRALWPAATVWFLAASALLMLVQVLFANQVATISVAVVATGVLLLILGKTAWDILSTHYRLTTQRLFIRRGVFSQTLDQTELLRVDDVRMRQSILQRLLGVGDVYMLSNDTTDHELTIHNVLDPHNIMEHIRRHTRTLQRRTVFMEQL